jgi:hypothetical protein
MCIHRSGPARFLLVVLFKVISQRPGESRHVSIVMPSLLAIRGMDVVAAGMVSQVMINSSDGNKAFAFFCTETRQYAPTGPVISSRFVVRSLHLHDRT